MCHPRTLLLLVLLTVTALSPCAAASTDTPSLPFDLSPVEAWSRLDAADIVPYAAEGIRSDLLAGFRSPAGSYLFLTRTDNTLQIPAFTASGLSGMFEPGYFADLDPRDFEATVVEQRHGRHGTLSWMLNTFLAGAMPYEAGNGDGPVLVRGAFLPVVVWHPGRDAYDNLMYAVNFRGAPGAEDDLAAFRRVWRSFELPPEVELVDAERFNALRPELLRREERRVGPAAQEHTDGRRTAAADSTAPAAGSLLELLDRASRTAGGGEPPAPDAYPDTVVGRVMAELAARSRRQRAGRVWATAFAAAPEGRRAQLAALFLGESLRDGHLSLAREVVASAREAGVDGGRLVCAEPLYLLRVLPAAGGGGDVLPLDEALACESFAGLLDARLDPLPLEDLLSRHAGDGGRLRRGRSEASLPRLAHDGGRWVIVRPLRRRRVRLEEVTDLLHLAPLLGED